jgi:hypothetical protein
MNLRERFADWVSRGALSEARDVADLWAINYKKEQIRLYERADIAHARIDAALAEIDRQKAPNATVRRIGKMLRGEQ